MTHVCIDDLGWPRERLGEALEGLVPSDQAPSHHSDLRPPLAPPGGDGVDDRLSAWIEAACSWLGIEAEPVECSYGELRSVIRRAPPALVSLPAGSFLLILSRRGQRLVVRTPGGELKNLSIAALCSRLCRELERAERQPIDDLLAATKISRRERAAAALLAQRLSARPLRSFFLLRQSPAATPLAQVREAGLVRRLVFLVAAHTAHLVLWVLSWFLLGNAVLHGHHDPGWLYAWGLALASTIPIRALASRLQGQLAALGGAVLKRRLLDGALRLAPDEVRHQGVGQLLGRVFESEVVEGLALGGGLLAIEASIELLLAGVVLALGAGGGLHLGALALWLLVTSWLSVCLYRREQAWSARRLSVTHGLIETMLGHRTRLAQQEPERLHDDEDRDLDLYHRASQVMDRARALLVALVPRGWVFVGLLPLLAPFASGSASRAALAVGLGGLLLAYQALDKLALGLARLMGAAVAWRQVGTLFRAAARPELTGSPDLGFGLEADGDDDQEEVLVARDLVYRFPGRDEPVLRGASLTLRSGDRCLITGPSGGGKSTLASLLLGMRTPDAGLLLVDGLDRKTLGADAWRRRIAAAPQFHENHVFSETFAFNLLMGRRWPPRRADLEKAEELCIELGLGELLRRMPAGLFQMVGETGWQLSHGEKSRLYIARALLQDTEIVVCDESFSALDPETLGTVLRAVLRRARTLVVIAHP
jgi:ATP-binding cassette subfamily B protein